MPRSSFSVPFFINNTGLNFIEKCIAAIEARGLLEEGIYRIPGASSLVSELMGYLRNQRKFNNLNLAHDERFPTPVIATAIKLYLSNLSRPLMTFKLYERFLSAGQIHPETERVRSITETINRLPKKNKTMLAMVMKHLNRVAEQSSVNWMTAANLAMCFGPTLLRPPKEVVGSLEEIHWRNLVTETMILNYNLIFVENPLDVQTVAVDDRRMVENDINVMITRNGYDFIKKCISVLETRGLKEVGLYGSRGSMSQAKELVEATETPELQRILNELNWKEFLSTTIASAIKLYYSSLKPEPLMTHKLHNDFIRVARMAADTERIKALRELVHQLPSENISLLKLLIPHLQRVASKSRFNLMTPCKLGISFGPILLRSGVSQQVETKEVVWQSLVVSTLIDNYAEIFETASGASVDTGKTTTKQGSVGIIDIDFINKCIDAVEQRGIYERGIYKYEGDIDAARELLTFLKFPREFHRINLQEDMRFDVKTIATAIRMYFSELPEPLITNNLQDKFTSAAKSVIKTLRISKMSKAIQKLPRTNFIVLNLIIRHLKRVADRSLINKTTSHELALCFGPALFKSNTSDGNKWYIKVVETLIDNYIQIFKKEDLEYIHTEEIYDYDTNSEDQFKAKLNNVGFTFIWTCTEEIERRGLDTVGLYYNKGDQTKVKALFDILKKPAILTNLDLSSKTQYPTMVITDAVKMYFRKLQDGLIMYQHYADLMHIQPTELNTISTLQNLVNRLSGRSYRMLRTIINHLRRIASQSEVNQMSIFRLGMIFGPLLFSPSNNDVVSIPESHLRCFIIQRLIECYEQVLRYRQTRFLATEEDDSMEPGSSNLSGNDRLHDRATAKRSHPQNEDVHARKKAK